MIGQMRQQNFIYNDPECTQIHKILINHNVKRFLLVCGSSFSNLSISHKLLSIHIPYTIFSSFTTNPLYEDVCKGVDLFKHDGCDFIIAVGGGSALDVAKCIVLFSGLNRELNYLHQEFKETKIPILAIPTTAGTGSESTRFAVIYYNGEKQSISSPTIIPNYVVLEPSVLVTLPIYQKKCSMLDALCQGIESWWSINSTSLSREFSFNAVSIIVANYETFLQNLPEGNEAMLIASNWAGKAINITQTTAPHAMSYNLTSLFNLPHGHAVSICLPFVWNYMQDHQDNCIDPRGTEYINLIFNEISNTLCNGTPRDAIVWIKEFLIKLDIKSPVIEDEIVLHQLAKSVNLIRLKNSPIELDYNSLYELYKSCLA